MFNSYGGKGTFGINSYILQITCIPLHRTTFLLFISMVQTRMIRQYINYLLWSEHYLSLCINCSNIWAAANQTVQLLWGLPWPPLPDGTLCLKSASSGQVTKVLSWLFLTTQSPLWPFVCLRITCLLCHLVSNRRRKGERVGWLPWGKHNAVTCDYSQGGLTSIAWLGTWASLIEMGGIITVSLCKKSN